MLGIYLYLMVGCVFTIWFLLNSKQDIKLEYVPMTILLWPVLAVIAIRTIWEMIWEN